MNRVSQFFACSPVNSPQSTLLFCDVLAHKFAGQFCDSLMNDLNTVGQTLSELEPTTFQANSFSV